MHRDLENVYKNKKQFKENNKNIRALITYDYQTKLYDIPLTSTQIDLIIKKLYSS